MPRIYGISNHELVRWWQAIYDSFKRKSANLALNFESFRKFKWLIHRTFWLSSMLDHHSPMIDTTWPRLSYRMVLCSHICLVFLSCLNCYISRTKVPIHVVQVCMLFYIPTLECHVVKLTYSNIFMFFKI